MSQKKNKAAYEQPVLCEDCGAEVKDLGPDYAFGRQYLLPEM
jgi:hypothetical protein